MSDQANEAIRTAAATMRNGGTLLYPTDSIWGLGCDATNAAAVEKVAAIKDRPAGKSFVVLMANDGMLQRYVPDVPDVAWELMDASDKPVTIVYQNVRGLAANALADDGSCAIRVVRDGVCNRLLTSFGKPVISTSVNKSGAAAAITLQDVDPAILNAVDYALVLQPEPKMSGTPSTIIALGSGGLVKVIRP